MMKGNRLCAELLATALLVTSFTLTGCQPQTTPSNTSSGSTIIADYGTTTGSVSTHTTQKATNATSIIKSIQTSVQVITGKTGQAAVTKKKYQLLKGDFCLIKNGVVQSTIVVAEDCDKKVYAAAWDLADNLEDMTGKEFLVVEVNEQSEDIKGNKILVGESKYTKELGVEMITGYPDKEGYLLISSLNFMVLAGNDESYYNGTAFAVTAFLESLGFGWFANDELWNVVPKANTVYAPYCNIVSTPSFSTRYNRVAIGNESSNAILAKRWFLGGQPSEVDHKFTAFFPTSKYGSINDIYAMVDGVRSIDGKQWWQACLSNQQVQDEVIRQVKEFFQANPEYVGVSIGQNDGNGDKNDVDYGNFCECDHCKQFANSFCESMIKFANIVGRAIKKDYPRKTVMIYAYGATFKAPTQASLGEKIEDNVLIMICRQGGVTRVIRNGDNFDETLNLTVRKRTSALTNDGQIAKTPQFKDNWLNWQALGAKNLALYEWNCPGAYGDNKWRYRFWVQGKTFIDNARWLKDNGCEFIFIDQGPNDSYESNEFDSYELRWPLWYVSAKAMWNCDLSFEDIMKSACKRLYGDAADIMYDFYNELANANVNCDVFCFEWMLPSGAEMYGNVSGKIDNIMAKARKQGATIGGDIQERIENQYTYWVMTKQNPGL